MASDQDLTQKRIPKMPLHRLEDMVEERASELKSVIETDLDEIKNNPVALKDLGKRIKAMVKQFKHIEQS